MGKGYLHTVLCATLVVVLALLCMYWLPDVTIGDWTMRKVDILSDVRSDSDAVAMADTLPAAEVRKKARIDTCKPGITCINDMAGTEAQGMEPLYKALDQVSTLGRPVRIAVLGDSYIEGDILTCHLRAILQQHYGGCGVGYLPMSMITAGFRQSVRQTSTGWQSHNANDKHGYDLALANFTGHYFFAGSGASTTVKGVKAFLPRLDTCQQSSLYYMGGGGSALASVNGGSEQAFELSHTSGVGQVTVHGRIGRVSWKVQDAAGTVFLGVSMDCGSGVVVDNYSLRSSTGLQYMGVSQAALQQFDAARHYDLVIFAYGLNVAGKAASKYTSYKNHLENIINKFKAAMPNTGFMVMSVGDRVQRDGGGFKPMKGVTSLVAVQQRIAYDTHVAFWNMHEAMGGDGSIVKMVEAGQANLDYTHINFKGGAVIARRLADAIIWGQQCYSKQSQEGGSQ